MFEVAQRDCYPCGEVDETQSFCTTCGRELFVCWVCGGVYFCEDDSNDHEAECDQRTVLDDIVDGLDPA